MNDSLGSGRADRLHGTERLDEMRALIAGAPDLLKACEAMLRKLKHMQKHFGKKWPLDLSPQKPETLARTAIAKTDPAT